MREGKVTPHFTWAEVYRSSRAVTMKIDNTPPDALTAQIVRTALGLERVRALMGMHPIQVSSWYRSPELNKAVGGAPDSQHTTGEAVDFTCPGFGRPKQIAWVLAGMAREIGFDQLILEPTWVHISFAENPRRIMLTAMSENGRIRYIPGILTTSKGSPA